MRMAGRFLRIFGRGVWRFVVGDTPLYLPAVVAIAAFALLAHRVHPALWFGLPVMVLAVLVGSVWRQTRVR